MAAEKTVELSLLAIIALRITYITVTCLFFISTLSKLMHMMQ